MPKRVIDGDAIWSSKKLSNIRPPHYRAEYTNLLPLALANGIFECDPRLIYVTVYAFNREDMTLADVVALLDEFERVKMLYRWQEQGKTWGYWVGIEKQGRLPEQSKQTRYKNAPVSVSPEKLAEFISGTTPEVIRTDSGVLALDRIGMDRNGEDNGQRSSESNSQSKSKPESPPPPVLDYGFPAPEGVLEDSPETPAGPEAVNNSARTQYSAASSDAPDPQYPLHPMRRLGFDPYTVEPFDGWTKEQLHKVIQYYWEYLPSIGEKSFWRDQTNTEDFFKRKFAKMAQGVKPVLGKKKPNSVNSAAIRRVGDPDCKVCWGNGIDPKRPCNLCVCVRFLNSEDQQMSYYDFLCVKQGKKHVDGMGVQAIEAYKKLGLPDAA